MVPEGGHLQSPLPPVPVGGDPKSPPVPVPKGADLQSTRDLFWFPWEGPEEPPPVLVPWERSMYKCPGPRGSGLALPPPPASRAPGTRCQERRARARPQERRAGPTQRHRSPPGRPPAPLPPVRVPAPVPLPPVRVPAPVRAPAPASGPGPRRRRRQAADGRAAAGTTAACGSCSWPYCGGTRATPSRPSASGRCGAGEHRLVSAGRSLGPPRPRAQTDGPARRGPGGREAAADPGARAGGGRARAGPGLWGCPGWGDPA